MPRLKVDKNRRRKTITFTLEQGDINELDNYVDYTAQSMPFAKISRQTILEHLVKDFLYAKQAARN